MATRASKFQVGLFLIGGFVLLNAAFIWVGASRLFETRVTYVTYFKESVQGLDVGSSVKYRGVPLGRVASIRVAPDGRLVEVSMDVDPSFEVLPEMRARLAVAGITGAAFVEIGFPSEGVAEAEPPQLSFPMPEHYIPSQPSFLTNLIVALAEVAATIQATDLPALAAEYRGLASDLRRLLDGPQVAGILKGMSSAADSVADTARGFDELLRDPRLSLTLDRLTAAASGFEETARTAKGLVADPRLSETLRDAREAAGAFRGTSEELLAQMRSLEAAERLDDLQGRFGAAADRAAELFAGTEARTAGVLDSAAATVSRADRVLRELDRSLQDLLTRLGRAASRLEELTGSLAESPSRLLLEGPPPEDFR